MLASLQERDSYLRKKAMNIGMEDACDTGLVLSLGRGDPPPKSMPSPSNPKLVETSLTLGLSDEAYMSTPVKEGRPSLSPHSVNSSFPSANPSNINRENDIVNGEADRVSSRTSDEEEEGGARKKLRLTKEQSALLEDKFKEHTTLNPKQKQALARQLDLRPRQVEVWFQNRRARTKLKQTEVDCEILKRCFETLSEENRRLQKELEELKALNAAPSPMSMPMPATLTLCPSCERVSGTAGEGAKAVDGPFILQAPKTHQFFNPFARSAAC